MTAGQISTKAAIAPLGACCGSEHSPSHAAEMNRHTNIAERSPVWKPFGSEKYQHSAAGFRKTFYFKIFHFYSLDKFKLATCVHLSVTEIYAFNLPQIKGTPLYVMFIIIQYCINTNTDWVPALWWTGNLFRPLCPITAGKGSSLLWCWMSSEKKDG